MSLVHDFFLPEIHQFQENLYQCSNFVIHDQTLVKVSKNPGRLEQQPTPEGIHQDNTEISSIIFMKTENVSRGAETRVWDLATPKGYYTDAEFEKRKQCGTLLFKHTLSKPFEAVFIQSVFNNLIAIESALLRLLEELILQNQVHRV